MDRWREMKRWQRWLIIGVGVFFLLGIIGALTAPDEEGTIDTSASQTTEAPATTTTPAPTTTRVPATTLPPTTAAPTTAAPTTAAGPKTTFGDGTYRVGTDIASGTYVAPGGRNCYWERQSSFGGGGVDSIIANDLSSGGQVVVTIAASDKGFKTTGCGTWSRG